LNNENHYENSKQQTIDNIYRIFPVITMMTSTSASVEENLATFIVKNRLSKDAIVTFVADTELYFT